MRCATHAPGSPKHARVPWRSLDDAIQSALLGDEKVQKAFADRKQECKGASVPEPSSKCEKLDNRFNDLIVDHVRKGGAVPPPVKVP